ncbi:phage holin family protein [Streptomyces sp. CA-250714]|uniref:phage holin family protein n=1 Tax=Streptomyces sp. CA-250714 TaxID=3240060 RepID=UPI003D8B8E13
MTTTHEAPPRTDTATPHKQAVADESVRHLVQQASGQISQLMRQELRLAQTEMQQKGKRFGLGGGMFGGAGVMGFIALQALAATAIVALDLVLPLWLAALVVTAALAVIAGTLAAVGKGQLKKATPPTPERAVQSVKADVAEVKARSHR